MVWLGMGLGWASYLSILYGYALIRGYDITIKQMVSPTGKWTTKPAGNTTILPTGTGGTTATLTVANVTPAATGTGMASGGTGAPLLGGGGSAAANRKLGQQMAARYGWTGAQWQALDRLWNQESGWSSTARNPTSGATGIPQLNPAAHAIPANWSSPRVQIAWGLAYIKSRYGSPLAAWNYDVAHGLQGY